MAKTASRSIDSTATVDQLLIQNASLTEQNRYLREQVELLKRHIFGHTSEKLPPSLMGGAIDLFGVDPVEPTPATVQIPAHSREITAKPGHGRETLPDNLPCEETILDVPEAEKVCPCCGKDRVCIGNDVREELDIVPPQFIKHRYLRPKYACRQCTECGVAQAEPLVSVIDKGIPSVGLVTWIILSKYLDHLPLYRIASQFKRWGVEVAETTMVGWITAVFELLGPIHRAMEHEIRSCGCLHVDETTLRVQRGEKDKLGLGKASVDYLWAMLGRAPDGSPVGVSFLYADGRQHAVAKTLLEGVVSGYVHSDGYPAYDSLCQKCPEIVHAACWAHVRRKFNEALQCGYTQANQPLTLIAKLYESNRRIERLVEHLHRRWKRLGQDVSQARIDRIIMDRRNKWMKPWMDHVRTWNHQARMDALPKGKLGTAIGYLHNQLPKLEHVLSHARVSLDNNIIERAIRPIAIGRKNWMVAGSSDGAERAALLISLVGTCKMLDVDPTVYFKDVLIRARLRPATPEACADLTPLQWKIARAR